MYAALHTREPAAVKKAMYYILLLFSFCLGAVVSTLLCLAVGIHATWVAAIFLLVWLVWLILDERRTAADAAAH